ncbi:MAG TPA: hypothetical protein VGI17_15395 [Solirubrobacterales bacterium]|jgi:hypothetical protein
MVTRLPLDDPMIVVGPVVQQDSRLLAVAPDHPLATRDAVRLEDLVGHPVLDLAGLLPEEVADAYIPTATPGGRPIPRAPDRCSGLSEATLLAFIEEARALLARALLPAAHT